MTKPKTPRRVRGYDQLVVAAVLGATPITPAVELGRFCVEHNVSVDTVSRRLGVSRQTVYSWFTGARTPRPKKLVELIELLAVLRTESA
ncbi:helix-turn-helix domain-containing protein [bacterium]|nr:helix-turn-helix domain-containing protein [bacterium]